ncbi:hypothetical protein VDP25_11095 [Winogradskyella sp. ECml5-4]|uniref:hypothetical protein n=1 Tax=Winogradskyella sp. ECml5-4 TaxID=3110975 RepID=UPI002FF40BFB
MLHAIVTSLLELIAAFSGFYFLSKNRDSKLRPFVYFLVITVFTDAMGSYTSFIDRIEFLHGLKTTPFVANSWLFNIYIVGSLFFYIYFYKTQLMYPKHKKILNLLCAISVLVVIINIYFGWSILFGMLLKYNILWTTLSVFICVSLYFYEVLMSDKILIFYKSTLFYISIGLLLWWLIVPPLVFYMPYYKKIYPNLVSMRNGMLIMANIYLYGCFTIGFIWGKE